jgi:hypothetical protein
VAQGEVVREMEEEMDLEMVVEQMEVEMAYLLQIKSIHHQDKHKASNHHCLRCMED